MREDKAPTYRRSADGEPDEVVPQDARLARFVPSGVVENEIVLAQLRVDVGEHVPEILDPLSDLGHEAEADIQSLSPETMHRETPRTDAGLLLELLGFGPKRPPNVFGRVAYRMQSDLETSSHERLHVPAAITEGILVVVDPKV